MEITVKLHGTLRRLRPSKEGAAHDPFALALDSGATVSGALVRLGVAQDIVSAVAVNGQQADLDTTLSDGDTLHIFPPAAGGCD